MRLAALLFTLALSSCVQWTWDRVSREVPLGAEALAGLEVGRDDLESCLARLGAPHLVLEDEEGDGAILVYVRETRTQTGLRLSVPLSDYASADFDYDRFHTRTPGAMLFFDADWRLVEVREGALRDLSDDLARRRPVVLDEE